MVVPPDKEGAPPPPAGKKVTYPLNSNDIVFSEFRDQNFDALAARIRSKAKHIKDAYDQLQALQNMHELRAFITTLPQTKQQEVSLSVLSNIAHKIAATGRSDDFSRKIDSERVILSGSDPTSAIAFIDELIDRQGPLVKVLRLLTLLSSIHGGLSGKHFEHYQRELLQTYGYEQLFTLHNLVRLGLIKRQGGPRSGFQVAHKPMRLWVPEVDKSEPEDIAFAYSGYAPLSVRLVQYAAAPGWRAMADVIRGISPTAFEVTQSLPPSIAANLSKKNRASAQQGLDKPPITLVFFIGGVTFGEIAALRYLATHSETKRNILIATTKLVNGDSLISSLMDAIPIPTLED
ncbi:MAG: Sec1 family protein [archaeon]|nr:Sec1 family protein [archaeon]